MVNLPKFIEIVPDVCTNPGIVATQDLNGPSTNRTLLTFSLHEAVQCKHTSLTSASCDADKKRRLGIGFHNSYVTVPFGQSLMLKY